MIEARFSRRSRRRRRGTEAAQTPKSTICCYWPIPLARALRRVLSVCPESCWIIWIIC